MGFGCQQRKVSLAASADSPVGAAVAETLSTDAAQVGLLAAVDPQVLFEGGPVRRGRSALASQSNSSIVQHNCSGFLPFPH